jgi:hypothetical protein
MLTESSPEPKPYDGGQSDLEPADSILTHVGTDQEKELTKKEKKLRAKRMQLERKANSSYTKSIPVCVTIGIILYVY